MAIAPLLAIGDHLGLFRAMADGKPLTTTELAGKTGTQERNVREWLSAMAASGYVAFEQDGRFRLTPEQVAAFCDEDSPFFTLGGFQTFMAAARHETREKLERAFVEGGGVGWEQHHPDLFAGTARFFRPGYAAHLVQEWLPALDGTVERLRTGASVADIGCGFGYSTMLMAQAFPASQFTGFDSHPPSIEKANELAEGDGLAKRTDFEVAGAADFGGGPYDLITFFDCLHDMGDPVGVLSYCRARLAEGGVVMLVEPHAEDSLADNLNPLGRAFYGASSLMCVPASQAQPVGRALGAGAGEARTREVAVEAGYKHFRRATETPFNLIYELRS